MDEPLFIFKRTVSALTQPLTVFFILAALAVLFRLLKVRRLATLLFLAGAALILACSFPPLSRAAARVLERQYPPLTGANLPASPPAAVVVLGSGVAHPDDPNLPALSRLGDIARSRLLEGVRLARLFPGARLFTCGFGLGSESCADAMAEAAAELGVAPERITRFSQALDTAHEAALTREAIGDGGRVIVVTSAVHMPRAMFYFRQAGVAATAAPCDFIAPTSDTVLAGIFTRLWQPRGRVISEHEAIWHEALGLLHLSLFRDGGR